MNKISGLIAPLLLLGTVPSFAEQQCLRWGPVELTGFLIEGVYPGPPEYTKVADGDAALRSTLLHLPNPVCIEGENELSDERIAATELVQVACDVKKRPRGEQITLQGELFPRHTGYHVTSALLDCSE